MEFERFVDEVDEPDEGLLALGASGDAAFREPEQFAGVAEQAVLFEVALWVIGGRVGEVDHQAMGSRVAGPA
jgi:hypothetical protein